MKEINIWNEIITFWHYELIKADESVCKCQSSLTKIIHLPAQTLEYSITKNKVHLLKWQICSSFTNLVGNLLTAVDLSKAPGAVYTGPPKGGAKPNVTLTLEDEDMVELGAGKLNPQKAFMSGKLKVSGNVMLTQKLQPLLRPQAKM